MEYLRAVLAILTLGTLLTGTCSAADKAPELAASWQAQTETFTALAQKRSPTSRRPKAGLERAK